MRLYTVLLGLMLGVSTTACGAGDWGSSWSFGTEVTVTPQAPSPSDEVLVTVSRWMPGYYRVANSTLEMQGNRISLDLQWVSGIGIPEYCRKTHTESVGKWNPGTYTVTVSNDGVPAACAFFTVTAENPESGTNSNAWSAISQLLDSFNSNGGSVIDRLRNSFPMLWPR